jgi:hypothetical protein
VARADLTDNKVKSSKLMNILNSVNSVRRAQHGVPFGGTIVSSQARWRLSTGARINRIIQWGTSLAVVLLTTSATAGASFFFSTGDPNGLMATASRPASPGKIEIETADDFILPLFTTINQATFTGLLPLGATLGDVGQVTVEIYRVFPKDSVNPPSGNVPTRVNSPSDNAFATRNSVASTLTFTTKVLNPDFTAANSVLNGINPKPNQRTGGEGPVTGQEVQFTVSFTSPLGLPADHYFFVPQVEVAGGTGDFYWLSAPKPIVPPGTPFTPDLQSWIRNGDLDPDWLRVGTDIVGATPPTPFNASFSLSGAVPDATWSAALLGLAVVGLGSLARRWRAPD